MHEHTKKSRRWQVWARTKTKIIIFQFSRSEKCKECGSLKYSRKKKLITNKSE